MCDQDASSDQGPVPEAHDDTPAPDDTGAATFDRAAAGLLTAPSRPEVSLSPVRAPRQLAPHSYAVGADVTGTATECSGRLILLHSPRGHRAWNGTTRLVAYVQAELDRAEAEDSLLPEVAWSWLNDSLDASGAGFSSLGGTVTTTSSARFGDLAGEPHTHQVEIRASWTLVGALTAEVLTVHAAAFEALLSVAAGLPPIGITALDRSHPRTANP